MGEDIKLPIAEKTIGQNTETERKALGKLNSGETVIDRLTSHLHGRVETLLAEALQRIDSEQREFFKAEVDLGRIIGESTCVITTEADEIIYGQRPKRAGLTRFVKNRKPEPSSVLTVVLMKQKDAVQPTYITVTAFVGHGAETEPWDPKATDASRPYWDTHALLWGSEPIVEGTKTKECPWDQKV